MNGMTLKPQQLILSSYVSHGRAYFVTHFTNNLSVADA